MSIFLDGDSASTLAILIFFTLGTLVFFTFFEVALRAFQAVIWAVFFCFSSFAFAFFEAAFSSFHCCNFCQPSSV